MGRLSWSTVEFASVEAVSSCVTWSACTCNPVVEMMPSGQMDPQKQKCDRALPGTVEKSKLN